MHVETKLDHKDKVLVLTSYLYKMKGKARTTPLISPAPREVFVSVLCAFLGIGTLTLLSLETKMPLLVASFGASAVLLFGCPELPFSQPRNVFFGHTCSAIVGVSIYLLFGLSWWSAAMATSIAIGVMLTTKTTHPPAGATALIAVLTKTSPLFILTPVAMGAGVLVVIALIVNNLSPNRSYPKYWV